MLVAFNVHSAEQRPLADLLEMRAASECGGRSLQIQLTAVGDPLEDMAVEWWVPKAPQPPTVLTSLNFQIETLSSIHAAAHPYPENFFLPQPHHCLSRTKNRRDASPLHSQVIRTIMAMAQSGHSRPSALLSSHRLGTARCQPSRPAAAHLTSADSGRTRSGTSDAARVQHGRCTKPHPPRHPDLGEVAKMTWQ